MKTRIAVVPILMGHLLLGQTSPTVGTGLNQNEVNVVRDGDFPESNSGVVRMLPNGKKGKVMQLQADSAAPGPAAADSSVRLEGEKTPRVQPVKRKPKSKTQPR